MIPVFHIVELFMLKFLAHDGIPSDIKTRVNKTIEIIGKHKAINNSIKRFFL
tara:strand:- start:26 stop:181 length:156 start_codon:yes stop_codon:yes gene_type:complete